MAAIAGRYAFNTIFEPKGSALEIGTDVTTALRKRLLAAAAEKPERLVGQLN